MIHTVRNPFFCRRGQFFSAGYPGQVLVVGIAAAALMKYNPYRFKIGKNLGVYFGDSIEALRIGQKWINKSGKEVYIVPVDFFKKEEKKLDKALV